MTRDEKNYDDIINLPHHVSETRPRMSALDRAAQFSPFAALTGYEDAVKETARLTSERVELDELEKEALDYRLQTLSELGDAPPVTLTYFVPDKKKAGGRYETAAGYIKKIDKYEGVIVLTDGKRISVSDLYGVESDAL